jgi:hypothetical protein
MDINEPGPSYFGLYNEANQTLVEGSDEYFAQVISANLLNNLLALLDSLREATSHIYVGCDLRQADYILDAGTNNNYLPPLYRCGRRQVSLNSIVGTFNVGDIVSDDDGHQAAVLETDAGGVKLACSFDTLSGTLTGPTGSGQIGTQVVITDEGEMFRFDGSLLDTGNLYTLISTKKRA